MVISSRKIGNPQHHPAGGPVSRLDDEALTLQVGEHVPPVGGGHSSRDTETQSPGARAYSATYSS